MSVLERVDFKWELAVFAGDRVIFAESPSAPGIPIVYRLPEERQANPDRLNLDRYLSKFLKIQQNLEVSFVKC